MSSGFGPNDPPLVANGSLGPAFLFAIMALVLIGVAACIVSSTPPDGDRPPAELPAVRSFNQLEESLSACGFFPPRPSRQTSGGAGLIVVAAGASQPDLPAVFSGDCHHSPERDGDGVVAITDMSTKRRSVVLTSLRPKR